MERTPRANVTVIAICSDRNISLSRKYIKTNKSAGVMKLLNSHASDGFFKKRLMIKPPL